MGGVYRESEVQDKMEDIDKGCYIRGKQIMNVSTFVREVEDLRVGSMKKNSLKGHGHMLPIVLVEKDTPSQIRLKVKALRKNGSTNIRLNRIISSSEEAEEEEEEGVDDLGLDLSSEENPSKAVSPEAQEPRPSSGISDATEYGDFLSDDESLPDLTETVDPSYVDGRECSPKKDKVTGKSPSKIPEKVRKRKKKPMPTLLKGSGGHLMKSARHEFMQKQKMFVRSDKDKRVLKSGHENERPLIMSSPEPPVKSSVTPPQPYRTTGYVELNPNAKSPKDSVERNRQRKRHKMKECVKDSGVLSAKDKEREEIRKKVLKNLESPPAKSKEMGSPPLGEPPLTDAGRLDGHGYESDETVTYDEDVRRRNAELLSDSSGDPTVRAKRKNKDAVESNKRLKGEEMSGPFVATSPVSGAELSVVSSPVMFGMDSACADEMEGEQQIMIQNVTGGVLGAFETPDKPKVENEEPKELIVAPPPAVSAASIKKMNIQQLKQMFAEKSDCEKKLSEEKELHEERLREEKAAYEKKVVEEKAKYRDRVASIEEDKKKLEEEISSLLMLLQSNEEEISKPLSSGNVAERKTAVSASPGPTPEPSQKGPAMPKTEPIRTFNIIPDANINNFGLASGSYAVNSNVRQAKDVASPATQPRVNVKEGNKAKNSRPRKSKSPSPEVMIVETTSSSSTVIQPKVAPSYVMAPQMTVTMAPAQPLGPRSVPANMVLGPDGVIRPDGRTMKTPPPSYYQAIHAQGKTRSPLQSPPLAGSQAPIQPMPSLQDSTPYMVQLSGHVQGSLQPQNQQLNIIAPELVIASTHAGIPTSSPPIIVNPVSAVTASSPLLNQLLDKKSPKPTLSSKSTLASKIQSLKEKNMAITSPVASSAAQMATTFPATSGLPGNAVRVNMGRGVTRPAYPQKSHLMVPAQPPITSGISAQARSQSSGTAQLVSSSGIPIHPVPKTVASPLESSSRIGSMPAFMENTSSPEAEQSCFLCGDPGEFVCCNSIVYCSAGCKEKDWGRHALECARTNSG